MAGAVVFQKLSVLRMRSSDLRIVRPRPFKVIKVPPLDRDPSFGRVFPWMDRAACWALAQRLIGVEPLVEWRKVLDDVRHRDLDAVHLLSTVEAVPLEAVTIFDTPRAFDYESD